MGAVGGVEGVDDVIVPEVGWMRCEASLALEDDVVSLAEAARLVEEGSVAAVSSTLVVVEGVVRVLGAASLVLQGAFPALR